MKIINEWPVNIEEIKQHFPVSDKVVITIGNNIYNPSGVDLPDHLVLHESVHAEQQKKFKTFEEYFKRYVEDVGFRFRVEAEAYGKQVRFLKQEYGLEKAMIALHNFAKELSGPLYGDIVDYHTARDAIRKQAYYV